MVVEVVAAMRAAAQRQHGQIDRVVLTIPSDQAIGDPRRGRLVAAAEAAGFAAVELLAQAVAAVSAQPPQQTRPFGRGDLVLVYDLGTGFEAAVVRLGEEGHHEMIGHAVLSAPLNPQTGVDQSMACCLELLTRLGLAQRGVAGVVAVGAGSRTPGIDTLLQHGLSAPVHRADEPELTVVRGAAAWLPRSGARAILPTPSPGERIMPLSFTLPGDSGRLLRWLVAPQQPYGEGQPLARVRLAGGSLWDLTARSRGVLDQILVVDGAAIHSGDWLALTRQ
jgi:molecular chaperone DnaK (HSP70)